MGLNLGSDGEHRYQLCKDEYCPRPWCRIYKEGYQNGHEDGYREGFDEGYAKGYEEGFGAGYGAGFSDGLASCPGPHGGSS